MAITFPASPVNGQTHTENGQIFVFDSTRGYWLLKKQDQIVASTSRSTFVATAGQTVHNMSYDPSASVIVSVNGVMLNPQDVTATNGTSITFDTALTLSDEVDIVFHQPTASNLIRQDISDPMATESYVQTYVTNNSSVGVTTVADMAALIALTGMANGDQALVTANNNLFIYSGSGWYKIATVQNDSPSAITGVSGTYELAVDGTATVITAASTDPEGFPLTWSYSASGLGSIATVSQSDNVFTITPSTTEADAGTFSLTINATDGINGAVSTSTNLSLNFILIVANSNYTTLLATATGTSDNNNITDSSSNSHSITVNGDVRAGTFSPYRSGGYSMYFDGGDYVGLGNGNLAINTEDFTIETWVNVTLGSTMLIANNSNWSAGSNTGWRALIMSGGLINITASQGTWNVFPSVYQSTNAIPSNEWAHVVICRDSGVISSYINGIKDPTTVNYSASLNQTGHQNSGSSLSSYSLIGAYIADGNEYNNLTGYLSDFHFKLGSAKYTTTFSPPTERLTVESGTDVLLFNKPFLKDESTNAYTTTISGDPKISPFSPDHLEYSATDHGGSVYIGGSGAYLQCANDFSTFFDNSWTIEFWAYLNTLSTSNAISIGDGSGVDGMYLLHGGNGFYLSSTGGTWNISTYTSSTIKVGQWHHCAVTWDGSSYRIFVDGVLENTATSSAKLGPGPYTIAVGAAYNGGQPTNGYLSDIRMTTSVVYTSDFTPPTAPLSTISGTTLHVKGTDASIIDKSQGANLKLVGNTTGSTTQVKFAYTKSMYFDGSGDYIRINDNKDILNNLINNDKLMTIEAWVYPTISRSGGISYQSPSILSIGNTYLSIGLESLTPFFYWWTGSGNTISSSNAITLNAWSHIAVVLDANTGSNNIKIYVNGNLDGQGTFSGISWATASQGDQVKVGEGHAPSANSYFQGYIQDLRITDSLARYTANFTPPTKSLEG